ncbi:MAG: methylated-DNA--[protein]-cysteine S-methyltransferase [Weeksellaceae bacterium]
MSCEFLYYSTLKTPIGELQIYATENGIRYLNYKDSHKIRFIEKALQKETLETINSKNKQIILVEKQLKEYFNGIRQNFDIPLDMIGTEFQKTVWNSLLKIPYGKTMSYLEQSKSINNPKAVRAVANANGRNPISIIIPCHRVIGTNGKLTGYAGGIQRKKFLLNLENPMPQFNF